VLGLAIKSADQHLAAVAGLANVFNDGAAIQELADAATIEEIQAIMKDDS